MTNLWPWSGCSEPGALSICDSPVPHLHQEHISLCLIPAADCQEYSLLLAKEVVEDFSDSKTVWITCIQGIHSCTDEFTASKVQLLPLADLLCYICWEVTKERALTTKLFRPPMVMDWICKARLTASSSSCHYAVPAEGLSDPCQLVIISYQLCRGTLRKPASYLIFLKLCKFSGCCKISHPC